MSLLHRQRGCFSLSGISDTIAFAAHAFHRRRGPTMPLASSVFRISYIALAFAATLASGAAPAHAAKIRMVFPGPVTTFSLPYLVAQKKGWLGDLEVEDIFVTGGRADATLVNTVTALKGVHDGKVTILTRLSKEFPGLGYVWNVVRTESLAKPEFVAAFQTMTDIGIRGSRFIMENPDEAAAI